MVGLQNIDEDKRYKYRGRTCKDRSLLESERLSKATLVVNSMCHMPHPKYHSGLRQQIQISTYMKGTIRQYYQLQLYYQLFYMTLITIKI